MKPRQRNSGPVPNGQEVGTSQAAVTDSRLEQCEMAVGMFFDAQLTAAEREEFLHRVECGEGMVVSELERLHATREALRAWCDAECSNAVPQLSLWDRIACELENDGQSSKNWSSRLQRRFRPPSIRRALRVGMARNGYGVQPRAGFGLAVSGFAITGFAAATTVLFIFLASPRQHGLGGTDFASNTLNSSDGLLLRPSSFESSLLSSSATAVPVAESAPSAAPTPVAFVAGEGSDVQAPEAARVQAPGEPGFDSFERVAEEVTRGDSPGVEEQMVDLVAFEQSAPFANFDQERARFDARLEWSGYRAATPGRRGKDSRVARVATERDAAMLSFVAGYGH